MELWNSQTKVLYQSPAVCQPELVEGDSTYKLCSIMFRQAQLDMLLRQLFSRSLHGYIFSNTKRYCILLQGYENIVPNYPTFVFQKIF